MHPIVRYGRRGVLRNYITFHFANDLWRCRLINLLIVAFVCSIIARPNCEFLVMIFSLKRTKLDHSSQV